MKKKILFVTQALWLGGIETALVNLINHLDYEKFEVTCLITEDYQIMADRLTKQCRLLVADRGRRVSFPNEYKYRFLYNWMEEPQHASRLRRAVWRLFRFFFRAVEMRLYSAYIRENLKNEHYDTAVIYSDRTAEIAVRAVNADNFLMFYHNADIGKAYHDSYGYKRCSRIIAVSESQCKKLKALRPRYADKMIAIPNYIDVSGVLQKAEEPVEAPMFPHKGIHLLSCGRLALQKGFDIAVDACAQIVAAGFDDVHWYIMGEGAEKKNLEALIAQKGMENHFHLIGTRKNPYPYMKAADLYIQPSRTEGYSLSILEARVLACPTVATFAAAEEQLTNGVTGSLCETMADSIAESVIEILQKPSIADEYRDNLKKFSFENANREILNQIESLL